MEISSLIQIISNVIESTSPAYIYDIYNTLSMQYDVKNSEHINGMARVIEGSFINIPGLHQSTAGLTVEFIYPTERFESVQATLSAAAKASAGLIVQNSVYETGAIGTTGVSIEFSIPGNRGINTTGESMKSTITCYFLINTLTVLANECYLGIWDGTYTEADPQPTADDFEDQQYYSAEGVLQVTYNSTVTYYIKVYSNVFAYDYKIIRSYETDTDKYENNSESQSTNTGQTLIISLIAPVQRNGMISTIKNRSFAGTNINTSYDLLLIDEGGYHYFDTMIVRGDIKTSYTPGNEVRAEVQFGYKREV